MAVRGRALPAGGRATTKAKAEKWIPHIPNYVWLAMVVLTFAALSVSTYMRAQQAEQDAVQSHAVVSSRAENMKVANKQLKQQTEQIKTNPHAATQSAQKQLRVLRPNEVVIPRP